MNDGVRQREIEWVGQREITIPEPITDDLVDTVIVLYRNRLKTHWFAQFMTNPFGNSFEIARVPLFRLHCCPFQCILCVCMHTIYRVGPQWYTDRNISVDTINIFQTFFFFCINTI